MRAVSSHRDHRGSKMRFLFVSAFLACAAAAPSQLLAPVAVAGIPTYQVIYPAAIPTLSPGDFQAAAIDAQVKARDNAIAAVDKAREIAEKASLNPNDAIVVGSDLVKANTEETLWSIQDKQWQALDALKTAEAQLDGALASNAPALAKNAVLGSYVTAVAPISPIAYTPGIVAPAVKSAEPAEAKEAKPEDIKEAATKTAEENKEENKEKDAVVVEATKRNLEAKPQLAPANTPLTITPYGYPIVGSGPWSPVPWSSVQLSPAPVSPLLPYGAYSQFGLAPSIVKSSWYNI